MDWTLSYILRFRLGRVRSYKDMSYAQIVQKAEEGANTKIIHVKVLKYMYTQQSDLP